MESQSWLSCFCSSQNCFLLLPFVIKKGWARISTKVHILWFTHWCLAIGWTPLDTFDPLAHVKVLLSSLSCSRGLFYECFWRQDNVLIVVIIAWVDVVQAVLIAVVESITLEAVSAANCSCKQDR